ncbi:hypothetical protein [Paraburkholderia sp. Clong3]|uniref:hypothetical protein n=1 Tax=Paraburkholderia sp. Clong3 TaxID=2991061 RepID=UPI003D1E8C91
MEAAVGSEDLLTSIVFERIAYLDAESFKALFAQLCPRVPSPGRLDSIDFWPRLELAEHIVEPDVVMTCESAVVLVEAKRWDTADMQSVTQVASELCALRENEPSATKLPLIALLVGGRQDISERATHAFQTNVETVLAEQGVALNFSLVAVRWTNVLAALRRIPNSQEGSRRLVDDIERGMAFHGVAGNGNTRLFDLQPCGIESARCPLLVESSLVNRSIVPAAMRTSAACGHLWQLSPLSIDSSSFQLCTR